MRDAPTLLRDGPVGEQRALASPGAADFLSRLRPSAV
jgi:hypothetical protein